MPNNEKVTYTSFEKDFHIVPPQSYTCSSKCPGEYSIISPPQKEISKVNVTATFSRPNTLNH